MRRQYFCFILKSSKSITKSRLTVKTTTNTEDASKIRNQKISRKVREDSVEAFKTLSFSVQTLFMIF